MVSAEKEIEANTENLDHDQTSPEEPKAVLDIPKKDPQYTILAVDDDSVNLQVELVRAYVSIEKARFEERLKVEYEVDDSVYAQIPLLIIQPLVESAIVCDYSFHKQLSSRAEGQLLC